MKRLPRIVLLLAATLLCVGCDQATKLAARTHLARGATISLLGDTLRLQYIENPGAFLSLGGTLAPGLRHALLVVGVAAALLAILIGTVAARRLPALRVVALALILGGGLGNLADRVLRDGRVIDFLNVGIGPLRTGIFNVADVVLMAGVALLLLTGSRASVERDDTAEIGST